MLNKVRVGCVGFGLRGWGTVRNLMAMDDVDVVAVCDQYEDRRDKAADLVEEVTGKRPFATCDSDELLKSGIDLVLINTSWVAHTPIAIAAMKLGIAAAFEVGGAYSIDDCWELVKTHERTGSPCMILSNCNYARREMALLRMVREGLFGEVVHCDGGYCHDLRKQVANGRETRHGRLNNYLNRNCENYPIHPLGPIAKILDINRGNRMMTLTSMSSRPAGMKQYIRDNFPENFHLQDTDFMQGDVVTTTIKCARGQTITLRLDTTLPRAYSRRFEVHGTKGMYMEDGNLIFLDGVHNETSESAKTLWNNAEEYIARYEHPLWQKKLAIDAQISSGHAIAGGHGGTDNLVVGALVKSIRTGAPTPIDVYDTASWIAVTVLSEESIALGGMPVPVPDFTNGRWILREPNPICEDLL